MIVTVINADNATTSRVYVTKVTARGAYTSTGQFVPNDRILSHV